MYDHNARQTESGESFYSGVFSAFAYPLRKDGLYIIIGGTVFFGLIPILSFIPILGWGIAFVGGAYMVSAMMNVVNSSSEGHYELPDWPDMVSIIDDIFMPWFRWMFTFVFCFAPAAYALFKGLTESALALTLVGLVYLPMALVAVSLKGSVFALNPLLVVPAIVKVPLQYMLAAVMIMVSAGLGWALELAIAASGSGLELLLYPISLAIGLYIVFVQMRILGLLYYYNAEKLNWFGEAEVVGY